MENQVTQKKKIFCKQNIPNILVVVRMCLVPIIVTLLILEQYVPLKPIYTLLDIFQKESHVDYTSVTPFLLAAGILFVLASFTDWLDGFLARKYNWISDFGKFWDPIADKVLINSTLIMFAWLGYIPVLIPVIMIARDVLVDCDRMVAAKQDIVVAANIYGKLKTILQMVGLIFIFFLFNGRGSDIMTDHAAMYWVAQNLLMYAATIMSVTSGIIYFVQISKARKEKNKVKEQAHE